MYALKNVGFSIDFLGLPIIQHLVRFRSMCVHSKNFCSLLICGCILDRLYVMMTKPSTYVMVLHVVVEVLKLHLKFFFSPNHLNCRSKKMMKGMG